MQKPEDIPTPYDSTLITLNYKLNGTYIYFGANGRAKKELQGSVDAANNGYNNASLRGCKHGAVSIKLQKHV